MIDTLTAFFCTARQAQSYLNLLYVLVALLTGCGYLVLFAIGISLTLATLLIGPGIPLALLLIVIMQQLATFERLRIRAWLRLDISPPLLPEMKKTGLWRRLIFSLKNIITWKNLTYFLVGSLFGTLSSGIVLSIFLLSLLLFAGSLASFINIGIDFFLHTWLFPQDVLAQVSVSIIFPIKPFADLTSLPRSLVLLQLACFALFSLPLFVSSLHLSNGLTALWGKFAIRMLGASQDDLQLLEARRQAELARIRAEQADQKRRELITNVSHDLRTPVASIRGHVEALLRTCDDGDALPSLDTLRSYLRIVHRETLQLGTLVDDLLVLARSETDELRLTLEPVSAAGVIEEVYQTLMPLAKRERQITMIRRVEEHLPPVWADRQRLTQILLNLARNAITYTPDGGIVSLALQRASDKQLALLVSDTGIGISPEEQERIFERFYRVDTSRSHRSGGAGLGLAIVREFVLTMGGSISVESTVGEGSVFRVKLPIAENP